MFHWQGNRDGCPFFFISLQFYLSTKSFSYQSGRVSAQTCSTGALIIHSLELTVVSVITCRGPLGRCWYLLGQVAYLNPDQGVLLHPGVVLA